MEPSSMFNIVGAIIGLGIVAGIAYAIYEWWGD